MAPGCARPARRTRRPTGGKRAQRATGETRASFGARHSVLQGPQIFAEYLCMRVLRSQRLLVDRERAPVERLGLGIATLILVHKRKVVETDGDRRMLRPQPLLVDRERALGERLGFGMAALIAV